MLSRRDLVGSNVAEVAPPELAEKFMGALQAAIDGGCHAGLEYDFPNDDKNRVHEARFFPLENGQVFVIVRDVSQTRRVELAEAASRAKTDFLANMSHELRTPLHGILSFARFGRKKTDGIEEHAKLLKYFNAIQESGETLLQLVDEVLDIAKLDAGMTSYDFCPLDISDVMLREVDQFQSRVAERGIVVDYSISNEPIKLVGDAMRIAQVIRNLLANAVKFSPEGGRIQIATEASDDDVTISVTDDGPGIPEEELEDIFAKFVQSSRTDSGAGGTGLGLSICKQIVQAHSGKLHAENSETGARFVVRFPLSGPAESEETKLTDDSQSGAAA